MAASCAKEISARRLCDGAEGKPKLKLACRVPERLSQSLGKTINENGSNQSQVWARFLTLGFLARSTPDLVIETDKRILAETVWLLG